MWPLKIFKLHHFVFLPDSVGLDKMKSDVTGTKFLGFKFKSQFINREFSKIHAFFFYSYQTNGRCQMKRIRWVPKGFSLSM